VNMTNPKQNLIDEANESLRELWSWVHPADQPRVQMHMDRLSNAIHALYGVLSRVDQIRTVAIHAESDLNHYLEQMKRLSGEGGKEETK
jgi:hypothetical protein